MRKLRIKMYLGSLRKKFRESRFLQAELPEYLLNKHSCELHTHTRARAWLIITRNNVIFSWLPVLLGHQLRLTTCIVCGPVT